MKGIEKDDPIVLLSKPSYKRVVLKLKAPYLNSCCYNEVSCAKLYKWIPLDETDITTGQSGKRVMKLKERSRCLPRSMLPAGCRGYETLFKAESSTRV